MKTLMYVSKVVHTSSISIGMELVKKNWNLLSVTIFWTTGARLFFFPCFFLGAVYLTGTAARVAGTG